MSVASEAINECLRIVFLTHFLVFALETSHLRLLAKRYGFTCSQQCRFRRDLVLAAWAAQAFDSFHSFDHLRGYTAEMQVAISWLVRTGDSSARLTVFRQSGRGAIAPPTHHHPPTAAPGPGPPPPQPASSRFIP